MKRIFIVGTPLFDYTQQVVTSLKNNEMEVKSATYRIPHRIPARLVPFGKYYERRFIQRENKRIKKIILSEGEFDYLLFFGMSEFSSADVEEMKENTHARVIYWFIDSIYNQKQFFGSVHLADLAICYNQSECEPLRLLAGKSVFFPLFFDPQKYFPIKTSVYNYDLFFVGALKSRIEYLDKLFRNLAALKLEIGVYGRLSPAYRILNRFKYPYFFRHHVNKALSHHEINRFYNQSHISLNLQPAQAVTALNIRTFEVCGSGGLQLTNGNRDLLQDLFSVDSELIYFSSEKELVNIIQDYFGKKELFDYERIRGNSGSSVRMKHTVDKRVKELILLCREEDD